MSIVHVVFSDKIFLYILKVLTSLLSPTAFALGSINFADFERTHVGLRWSNMSGFALSFFISWMYVSLNISSTDNNKK